MLPQWVIVKSNNAEGSLLQQICSACDYARKHLQKLQQHVLRVFVCHSGNCIWCNALSDPSCFASSCNRMCDIQAYTVGECHKVMYGCRLPSPTGANARTAWRPPGLFAVSSAFYLPVLHHIVTLASCVLLYDGMHHPVSYSNFNVLCLPNWLMLPMTSFWCLLCIAASYCARQCMLQALLQLTSV